MTTQTITYQIFQSALNHCTFEELGIEVYKPPDIKNIIVGQRLYYDRKLTTGNKLLSSVRHYNKRTGLSVKFTTKTVGNRVELKRVK